jgi:hypothetical protein
MGKLGKMLLFLFIVNAIAYYFYQGWQQYEPCMRDGTYVYNSGFCPWMPEIIEQTMLRWAITVLDVLVLFFTIKSVVNDNSRIYCRDD